MWLNQRSIISLEVGNKSSMNFNNFTNCRYIPAYARSPLIPYPTPEVIYVVENSISFVRLYAWSFTKHSFYMNAYILTFFNDIYCQ